MPTTKPYQTVPIILARPAKPDGVFGPLVPGFTRLYHCLPTFESGQDLWPNRLYQPPPPALHTDDYGDLCDHIMDRI